METAIAQVCHNYEFRLSGALCLICADQDHLSVDVVAPRSARYALQPAAERGPKAQLESARLAL